LIFFNKRATWLLVIHNVGLLPANHIKLTVKEQYSRYTGLGNPAIKPFSWDDEIIQKHLPLNPEERFELPIHVVGMLEQ
jgi:hypothetical protein